MKLVSKLLLIFFMLGLISVCLTQKVLAELSEVEISSIQSFQLSQSKANQGGADAQFNLALLYYHGIGTPRDNRYAIYWYTKAAQQGHVNAQYNLGRLYMYGYGEEVQEGSNRAAYWLTKASEQGLVQAQYNLGHMYEWGDGGPQDYKLAFFWYTKAAEQGNFFAKEDRDKMLERMSQSQIEEDQKLSKEFYEKIDNKAK